MSISAEPRYKMNVRLSIKGVRANVLESGTDKSERLDEIDCLHCVSPQSIQAETERLYKLIGSATKSDATPNKRGVVIGNSFIYCFVFNSDDDQSFMNFLQRLLRQPRNLMKDSIVLDDHYVSEIVNMRSIRDIKYVKGAKFIVDVSSEPVSVS